MRVRTAALGLLITVSVCVLVCQTLLSPKAPQKPARSVSAAPKAAKASTPKVVPGFGKLPLRFEPMAAAQSKQATFVSRGRGYSLYLSPAEATMVLRAPSKASRRPEPAAATPIPAGLLGLGRTGMRLAQPAMDVRQPAEPAGPPAVVKVRLFGANTAARSVRDKQLPGVSNYFIGNDRAQWRTNVPQFGQAGFEQVYPGIDVVYYGNENGLLEHDFTVAPGADPSQIEFAIEGARRVRHDREGQLVLSTGDGEVSLKKPVAYQLDNGQRTEVTARFERRVDGRWGFKLGGYDKARRLVIDPVLAYSTYLGGGSSESSKGIAVDGSGNAYVTGQTASTNYPTTVGALQTSGLGSDDAFVSKLNASGTALLYSTYLGGRGNEEGYGIAVDGSGNAYVTGYTGSTDYPTTAGALQTSRGGGFVSKLNASGTAMVYSTYLGGGGASGQGYGIALDGSGNAYVTGYTASTNYPITAGAFQTSLRGSQDGFVSKLNASGTAMVYSTYLGGDDSDYGDGIAVDGSGNAYVTGYTRSTNYPTMAGAPQASHGGGSGDGFVSKLNASGTALVYSTYLGGGNLDYGQGIALDGSGNAYVTGQTTSTNYPTTAGALQASLRGSQDGFVSKLNASGTALVYSTYLGGGDLTYGQGIAVDGGGNAYVTGYTYSTNYPTTAGALQTSSGGVYDAFLSKLNASGTAMVYSTYLGGGDYDYGQGIAVDGSGNAYVTGRTTSTNYPTTAGALQASHSAGTGGGDGTDSFVSKIGSKFGSPPIISGTLTRAGTALVGVMLTASGTGAMATSAADGTYSIEVAQGWSGTITPSLAGGWTFSPASRTYSDLTTDQSWQDFVMAGTILASLSAISVSEGGSNTFTITLAQQPASDVTVSVRRVGVYSDIIVSGGSSLTFTSANWSTPQTVTLAAAEDADAINGTATFTASATGWTSADVTATEADNDFRVLTWTSVSTVTVSVPEGSTNTFGVSLAGAPAADVTVSVARLSGDSDLSVSAGASLTFTSANWITPQPVTLAAAADADAINGTATFTASATGWTSADVTATEADDDAYLVVSPTAGSVPEGGTQTFTVALAGQPATDVTVAVARTAGDTDLTVSSGASLTFTSANWNTPQTVSLAAAPDADAINGTATFTASATGWAAADVTATEADSTMRILAAPATLTVPEGGNNSFSVRLAGQPAANVAVGTGRLRGDTSLRVSAGASLTFTPSNWYVSQLVTIYALPDTDKINGQATFRVSASGWPSVDTSATELDSSASSSMMAPPYDDGS